MDIGSTETRLGAGKGQVRKRKTQFEKVVSVGNQALGNIDNIPILEAETEIRVYCQLTSSCCLVGAD